MMLGAFFPSRILCREWSAEAETTTREEGSGSGHDQPFVTEVRDDLHPAAQRFHVGGGRTQLRPAELTALDRRDALLGDVHLGRQVGLGQAALPADLRQPPGPLLGAHPLAVRLHGGLVEAVSGLGLGLDLVPVPPPLSHLVPSSCALDAHRTCRPPAAQRAYTTGATARPCPRRPAGWPAAPGRR